MLDALMFEEESDDEDDIASPGSCVGESSAGVRSLQKQVTPAFALYCLLPLSTDLLFALLMSR